MKNNTEPYDYARYCGYNNCPNDRLPDISSKPSLFSVYLLCGSMISLCILAMVVTILLVDNIKDLENGEIKGNKKTMGKI